MTSRKHVHKATENPWESENVTLSAYLQEVTLHRLNSVHMSCLCTSHGNKPPSPSCHTVSFQVRCCSASPHPLRHPRFTSVCLLQGSHFIVSSTCFMFKNHNTVVLPFWRSAQKEHAAAENKYSSYRELRTKLEREFGSQGLRETRGPGRQCPGLCVQPASHREDHCLFPFSPSAQPPRATSAFRA